MAKQGILNALQSDMDDPDSFKSGEFLQERVFSTIRSALSAGDRAEVVGVLRDWMLLRKEPETMLAVRTVKEEHLRELGPDIESLRADVVAGKVFFPFYLRWIDEALSAIGRSPSGTPNAE